LPKLLQGHFWKERGLSMKKEPTYSIGEVARHVGCHADTLKRYEQAGYIDEVRRSARGHRRYTRQQRDKLRQVFDAKNC